MRVSPGDGLRRKDVVILILLRLLLFVIGLLVAGVLLLWRVINVLGSWESSFSKPFSRDRKQDHPRTANSRNSPHMRRKSARPNSLLLPQWYCTILRDINASGTLDLDRAVVQVQGGVILCSEDSILIKSNNERRNNKSVTYRRNKRTTPTTSTT